VEKCRSVGRARLINKVEEKERPCEERGGNGARRIIKGRGSNEEMENAGDMTKQAEEVGRGQIDRWQRTRVFRILDGGYFTPDAARLRDAPGTRKLRAAVTLSLKTRFAASVL